MQIRGFIFLQKSKIKTLRNRKKNFFQLIHFRKSKFLVFAFLQKMLDVSSKMLNYSFQIIFHRKIVKEPLARKMSPHDLLNNICLREGE